MRFLPEADAGARLDEVGIGLLREAFDESRGAYEAGERPCAALVVSSTGHIVARAWNRVNSTGDFSAHAETAALRAAVQTAQGSGPSRASRARQGTAPSPRLLR